MFRNVKLKKILLAISGSRPGQGLWEETRDKEVVSSSPGDRF